MLHPLSVRLQRLIFVPLVLLAFTTPAWSQTETDVPRGFAKQGGYAGLSGIPGFTFDGITFDGATWYQEVDGDELAILPRLDKRPMMRALIGYRYRRAALEFSYERVRHHGSFDEFPVETVFQTLNIDARMFFLTRSRVQPHLLVGGAYPWLKVKDGSFLDPNVGDARWNGVGLNTEAGVTLYPHPQLGIAAGYAYRVVWFDRMTGVSDRWFELRPRFRETSGSVVVTGMVTF